MKYVLLIIVLILVILPVILSAIIFHFFFHKPKRSTKIPAYYVGTPHYVVSRKGMELMKGISYEDLYRNSYDGLKLHAYLFPAEEGVGKKFLLGVHGYRSYARPEFGPYIEFYRSLGYSLLLPDDRAHAPSEGKYIGFGVLDRLDCVAWAQYIVDNYGDDAEIIIHGVSMGAATVLAASGENLPSQVKGIVSDCGYTSAEDIIKYHFKNSMHLPIWPIYSLCEKICEKRAGFNFHTHTPIEQVQRAKVPILFVHGVEDKMVPVEMVQRLYDACKSKKEILIVDEAGHGESIAFAPDEYHRLIRELFEI